MPEGAPKLPLGRDFAAHFGTGGPAEGYSEGRSGRAV
jgi:hypothetical protein